MSAVISSRPSVSSPLANARDMARPQRPTTKRTITLPPLFPTSRPLRPFASVANAMSPTSPTGKATKIIQPPKNFKSEFVLNLTQAELSRQD